MYREGHGVPQDYAEAVKWFRLSAGQGYSDAQGALGEMWPGHGVAQDYVQAHVWFDLAYASGDLDSVKNRDAVARQMTPGEIAEAQRRAREWKPKTSLAK